MSDRLPIYELESTFVAAARRGRRLVVRAPTGSGKSTQIPRMLLRHGLLEDGICLVLQPRRIAARLLATRVAAEEGGAPGGVVGYRVRLEGASGPETRILFVTEGLLLRRLVSDPDLRGVSTLVFDEFHERHLDGDVSLGFALRLQETRRPDLRLIVMSATLDTVALERPFRPDAVLESAGRTFPVEVAYLPRPVDFEAEPVWEAAANACAAALEAGAPGDALVFMPGAYEIQRTLEALAPRLRGGDFELRALHGELPAADQDAAVGPAASGRRRVIVSTNVAETSLTLPGIRLVIDSGLARLPRYDPQRGINTLLIERISRASADQRAGRAGRTAPGRCIRLWTEREHEGRRAHDLPEVRRLDLAEVLLALKGAGVGAVSTFPWIEEPEPRALERGLALLFDLGATEGPDGPLTPVGRRMLTFPLHPRYARMLIEAEHLGCVRPTLAAAALSQARPILLRQVDRATAERRDELFGGETDSDFARQILALHHAERLRFAPEACGRLGLHGQAARQAWQVFQQLLELARREGLDPEPRRHPDGGARLRRCVLAGFADQVARRLDRATLRCAIVHGRKGVLARESVAGDAACLVAAEISEIGRGSGEVETLLSLASAIDPAWLGELFPHAVRETVETVWEVAQRRCVSRTTRRYHDLVLAQTDRDDVDLEAAARILADGVLDGRIELPGWDETVEHWLLRVDCLRRWRPELGLPEFTEADRRLIVEQVVHGAAGARDLRDRPVLPAVRDWLPAAQQAQVERDCPERIELPGGRRARIQYDRRDPPKVASRLQDFYGHAGALTLCGGRVRLRIELLAPNQRAVQVTDDLAGFWRDVYPRIKAELQRRYPRHEWR